MNLAEGNVGGEIAARLTGEEPIVEGETQLKEELVPDQKGENWAIRVLEPEIGNFGTKLGVAVGRAGRPMSDAPAELGKSGSPAGMTGIGTGVASRAHLMKHARESKTTSFHDEEGARSEVDPREEKDARQPPIWE